MLTDSTGRTIRYLRLSLTDACHMRCIYCRPDSYTNECSSSGLSVSELKDMVGHLVKNHGLRKVRLTGGEPTARRDIVEIVAALASLPGLEDMAMTTNGLTLPRLAGELAGAGLRRVNISLDSTDPALFSAMTGVDRLDLVMEGIEAARRHGMTPVKMNTVVLRGHNEDELPDLVEFAAERQLIIRFIELMPMGPLAEQWSERYVSTDEMLNRIDTIVAERIPVPGCHGAARYHDMTLKNGKKVQVGFISAMSCPFCSMCDRLRITSDGTIYPCLMGEPDGNILAALRPKFDPELLDRILNESLTNKVVEHPATGIGVMTHLGG